jgi:hypothetical protein
MKRLDDGDGCSYYSADRPTVDHTSEADRTSAVYRMAGVSYMWWSYIPPCPPDPETAELKIACEVLPLTH